METARLIDPGFWVSGETVAPGASLPARRIEGLASHVLFRTSGSSGRPKWIALTREALLLSAAVVNRHLGIDAGCRWGLALPVHHVGGFGVIARAYESGAVLSVFDGPWEPARFADWLGREKISHTTLVPTQVHDLVTAGLRAPGPLRTIVVGGGVLDGRKGAAARDLGWPVLASYGMTEAASQIATQNPDQLLEPYQSAPLPPLPHWRVRIGGGGRIEISGGSLFSGWIEENAGFWRFVPRDDEWFATSDRGNLTAGGLTMTGRSDTLVKILGELVDPGSVERELAQEQVTVMALPDPRRGHRLVAVTDDPRIAGDLDSLLKAYNRKAEGPRRIECGVRVERIPRSPLGKILRSELAALLGSRTI